MGTCAKIGKLALSIKGYDGLCVKLLDELYLVRLVSFLHIRNSLVSRLCTALKSEVFLYYLFHLALDLFKYLGSKGYLGVKIIVKAVFNSRSYGKLRFGVEAFYCLRKYVAGSMSEGIFALLVLKCVKCDLAVHVYRL